MKTFNFELVGTRPLLLRSQIDGDDPAIPWWRRLYYDSGQYHPERKRCICVPATNISRMLRFAVPRIQMHGDQVLHIMEQEPLVIHNKVCPLYIDGKLVTYEQIQAVIKEPADTQWKLVKKLGFELYTAKRGHRIRETQPRFPKWRVVGEIPVHGFDRNVAVVQDLFQFAGVLGLGNGKGRVTETGSVYKAAEFGTFKALVHYKPGDEPKQRYIVEQYVLYTRQILVPEARSHADAIGIVAGGGGEVIPGSLEFEDVPEDYGMTADTVEGLPEGARAHYWSLWDEGRIKTIHDVYEVDDNNEVIAAKPFKPVRSKT